MSELLGARKPILFCEGTKSSLDYIIYSSLFKDSVIVYPVKGHNNVIQYTRSYNKLTGQLNGNKAVGIIDGDLMSSQQIQDYKEDSIYTLNFNEIEMLLLTEEVMYEVLRNSLSSDDQAKENINNFKSQFMTTITKNIDKILFEKNKKEIDYKLSNYKINESKSSEEISTELISLVKNLNTFKNDEKFKNEINDLIKKSDYINLLKICPLKEQISKGLANQFLDTQYQDRALNKMKSDKALPKKIKQIYFKDLESEISSLSLLIL